MARERQLRRKGQIAQAIARQRLTSAGLGGTTVVDPIMEGIRQQTEEAISNLPPRRTVYATPSQQARWGPQAWNARAQARAQPQVRPDPQTEAQIEDARWRQRQVDIARMKAAMKKEDKRQQNTLAREKIMRLNPALLDVLWGINDETDIGGVARGKIRTFREMVQKGALRAIDAWPLILKLLEDYATGAVSMAQKIAQQEAKEQEALDREDKLREEDQAETRRLEQRKDVEAARKEEARVREAGEKETTRVRERQEDITRKAGEATATAEAKAEKEAEVERKTKRSELKEQIAVAMKLVDSYNQATHNYLEAQGAEAELEAEERTAALTKGADTAGVAKRLQVNKDKKTFNQKLQDRVMKSLTQMGKRFKLDVKGLEDDPSSLLRKMRSKYVEMGKAKPATQPTTQPTSQPAPTTQPAAAAPNASVQVAIQGIQAAQTEAEADAAMAAIQDATPEEIDALVEAYKASMARWGNQ